MVIGGGGDVRGLGVVVVDGWLTPSLVVVTCRRPVVLVFKESLVKKLEKRRKNVPGFETRLKPLPSSPSHAAAAGCRCGRNRSRSY